MLILIIDVQPERRAALLGRAQEAARQADIRFIDFTDIDPDRMGTISLDEVAGCLVGPGAFPYVEESVERVRSYFPSCPIGVVLENEVYASQAVRLRKNLNLKIMPLGDLAQIAGFLIDCQTENARGSGAAASGVFGVAQLKGGVGVTTLVAA
ncbi:MAG: hypothetical protein KDD53_06655, partial [Bdellovibrionales bacterium]|nr:hypothetical protein [Bdellovibrionales bacterium]